MNRWAKVLLIVAGVLALMALLAATLLPVVVRNQAVKALAAATGRAVRIEKVTLNPLTLRATVQGFAIEEQGGGPFFSLEALTVQVSPTSLYRRALVLSEVSIATPALRVVRTAADRFNFTEILERQKKPEEKKPEPAAPFPFVVNHLRLTQGSLELDDRAVAGGRKHSLRNLEIDLPWLSSLPDESNREAEPRVSLVVNGAPLSLTGKVKPFGDELTASLRIVLQKLALPALAVYVPQAPPVTLASGSLSTDLNLRFRRPSAGKPELDVAGLARLDGLALDLRQGDPLLKISALEVRAAGLEPLAGKFAIESITLDAPEIFVSRDRQGKWMYASLLPPPAGKAVEGKGAPVARAAADEKPLPAGEKATQGPEDKGAVPAQFSVASLKIQDGLVHFRDEVPRGGFKADVTGIALAVANLTNRPGEKGTYDLALKVDRETALTSKGGFTLAEPTVQAGLELTGLPLQKGWPYLAAYLKAPVQGVADLAGEFAFSADGGLIAEKGRLALKNVAARYGDGEGLKLAGLLVEGATFHQQANRLEIDRIRLTGGDVTLSREADGSLSPLSLLLPQEKAAGTGKKTDAKATPVVKAAAAPRGASAKGDAAKPLAYQLKRVDLERFNVAFTDKTRPEKPRFTLGNTSLSLAGLQGPAPRPARLRFASTFGTATALSAAGELTPAPFRYKGNLKVGRLPIRDFESYYAEKLNLQVLGGLLDVALALDIALEEGAPTGGVRGEVGLSEFHAVDAVEQEDLLKWQRLQLEKIDGDLKPFRLSIDQVALNEVYARIIIREDGTINLQNLVRKPAQEGEKPAKPAAAAEQPRLAAKPAASPEGGAKAPAAVRIGAVTLLNGTVAFTDKHLPNDFETTLYNLAGRISGLSS